MTLPTQLDRIELSIDEMNAKLDQLLAPKKKPKPRTSKRHEYDAKFELIWEDYPKCTGANKAKAYTQYKKRVEEYIDLMPITVVIHQAVIKYATFIEATGRYVMLPATFFGPDKHYENVWTLPKVKPEADPNKQRAPGIDEALKPFEPTTAFVEPHPMENNR